MLVSVYLVPVDPEHEVVGEVAADVLANGDAGVRDQPQVTVVTHIIQLQCVKGRRV